MTTINGLRRVLVALVIFMGSVITNEILGEELKEFTNTFTLTISVKTYDGLELPAQVINTGSHDNKMILFINGSTPYDEKGNIGAFWTDEGKIIRLY